MNLKTNRLAWPSSMFLSWVSLYLYFALNIDTPNRWDDLYKREAIVRDILLSIQALPSNK